VRSRKRWRSPRAKRSIVGAQVVFLRSKPPVPGAPLSMMNIRGGSLHPELCLRPIHLPSPLTLPPALIFYRRRRAQCRAAAVREISFFPPTPATPGRSFPSFLWICEACEKDLITCATKDLSPARQVEACLHSRDGGEITRGFHSHWPRCARLDRLLAPLPSPSDRFGLVSAFRKRPDGPWQVPAFLCALAFVSERHVIIL